MSRSRIIARNVLSNWMGFAVQAAVIFFLTPFVLSNLGETRYGIWVLATSVTGYYGLLSLGFQAGITQYLTRHLATGDFQKMNAAASTAFVVLLSVAALVLLISFVLAMLAPSLFNIPPQMEPEVFWCIGIAGCSVAVEFALFVFSAVFVATQRFDIANAIGITTRILNAMLVYLAISSGYGLVGVAVATALSNVLGYIARWRIAYLILPQLHVSWILSSKKRFDEIFAYGTWSFLISVAQSIFLYVDALVIGACLPIAALVPYALAAGLIRQIEGLLRPVDRVFFPAVTEMHAKGERDNLREVYFRGSRIQLLMLSVLVVVSWIWASDFYRLWIGIEYVTGTEFPSTS